MIGLEQAGIAETMDYMFKKFTPEDQNRLAQYVFLTGSNANFPNLLERISKELLEMRPFQSTFNVFKAGMYCRWGVSWLWNWYICAVWIFHTNTIHVYQFSEK